MAKKLKILFAINCMNIGGAPSVVFNQIKFLDREKFEPYLLTLYPSKQANFLTQMDFLPNGHQAHFQLRNRSIFDLRTIMQMYRYMNIEKFDVVYTHLFLANFLVRTLAILARVPGVLSFEHSIYPQKSRWQIFSDRLLSKFTQKIIVPTEFVAQFTQDQEQLPKEKFAVVSNPVYIPDKNDSDREELLKIVDHKEHEILVVTIGRFSEDKGHEDLVESAVIVHATKPLVRFIIIGHGPSEQKIRQKIKDLHADTYVTLLNMPERAKQFLHIADIFALPSWREGQPVVLLESMLAGLPAVATRVGGVPDVAINEKTAIVVEPRNPAVFAEAICRLADDVGLRQSMGQAARERVFGHFLGKSQQKLEEIFTNSAVHGVSSK